MIAPPWMPVPPLNWGGTELIIDVLTRGLAERGHEVVLFAHPDSQTSLELRSPWVDTTGYSTGPVTNEVAWCLAAYEQAQAFDIIHDHTLVGPAMAEPVPRVPRVATCHWPYTAELGVMYSLMSRRTPLIAISHSQLSSSPVPVASVIHHGIDVDSIPTGDGSGGYLAFLGRMTPEKGPHIAARIAQEQGVPLLIAAKMHEDEEIEFFNSQVKPFIGGDVQYVGEVGGYEKYEFLGNAIALLNPIQWPEAFGLVMAEALACGTPVISNHLGAAPEIIAQSITGLLCRSETEIKDAIVSVERIARDACRLSAEAHFSRQRMANDHEQLYHELIERSQFKHLDLTRMDGIVAQ